jgi:hypothetical protein
MGTSQIGLRDIQSTKRASRLRLLAPMRYLLIEAPEKHFYDVTLPIVAGAAGWAVYNVLDPAPAFFGPAGILVTAQSFLIMAVPFLIGSLGAVAMGSPGQHLDRRAAGVGIFLDGHALTLRQFVSYLLGYLCFVGLVFFVGITIAIWVQPALAEPVAKIEWVRLAVEQAGIALTMVFSSSFVITVLWALYFLTDIVNRHE